MRKGKWMIGIALCLAMLIGCTAAPTPKLSETGRTEGEIWCYNGFEVAIDAGTGFYYTGYHEGNYGFLKFFDYDAQEETLVCNQPNCRHEEGYESTPLEERCGADVGGRSIGFIEGEKLYLLEQKEKIRLVESDLDRTNQREIQVFEDSSIYSFAVKADVLYVVMYQSERVELEDGSVMSGPRRKSLLLSIQLPDGETETLMETEQISDDLKIIGGEDDKIYLKHNYFDKPYDGTNFQEANLHVEYYEYDMETGMVQEILEGLEEYQLINQSVVNGVLFAYAELQEQESELIELRRIDLDTGETKVLAKSTRNIALFENYTIYEKDGEKGAFFYDFSKEEEIAVPKMDYGDDIILLYPAGEYIYGIKYENEELTESSMGFFLLSDMMEGKECFYAVEN